LKKRTLTQSPEAGAPARSGLLAILVLLFIASGCSALIYEIVWFQLLQLLLGSSAISLAVVLAVFMGGMCLGSLVFPRLVSPRKHPLKVYALLEVSIGALGLLLLIGMPQVERLYAAIGQVGTFGIAVRVFISAVCLLPPTMLMGATLPAISRWLEATPKGISWLGIFYGGNIAGAVLGSLLTGFYIRVCRHCRFRFLCARC
jgi:spermidine synthase